MSRVRELFGYSVATDQDWATIVTERPCRFSGRLCFKTRKSDPSVAIGTCVVDYPKSAPVIICPVRLTERRQIFTDCLHLLTAHEPGNELHLVSEISIPGGNVDYMLASVRQGRVVDFVGIELQTLDTTGTIWPDRQHTLMDLGLIPQAEVDTAPFGMNWKMTAKTILVQMHHKAVTFEHVGKRLVLVVQDRLMDDMRKKFTFDHVNAAASLGDSVHFHVYCLAEQGDRTLRLQLNSRSSTTADGVARCLGTSAEPRIELDLLLDALRQKISPMTLFTPA